MDQTTVRELLIHLDPAAATSLQAQLRQVIVSAILDGQLPPGEPLPSCRRLAHTLGIARNTVMLAYQSLVDEGFLEAHPRSGYYVNPDALEGRASAPVRSSETGRSAHGTGPDWQSRYRVRPSIQGNIDKPRDWQTYPYPFVAGQVDPALFPISAWRQCSRDALAITSINAWSVDWINEDDPLLIQQIRARALPRRGIRARGDEILVTVGAQQALYLVASLLIRNRDRVAIEEPCYPDARNIFNLRTSEVVPIPVDEWGMTIDQRLATADYVYVTPSHQHPTTVKMTLERRHALLEQSTMNDFIIIEDDYEAESNYVGTPTPALKSLDTGGRVIYIGSLSKTIAPGLRLGYIVAPADLTAELRALRRLMVRHPASNNQRTLALFLSQGHFDAHVRRLHHTFHERWDAMSRALDRHLPGASHPPTYGGTSYWVVGPEGLDARRLARTALDHGVVIEPGDPFYAGDAPPTNRIRLGFAAIQTESIEPGIRILAGLIRDQMEES